MQRFAKLVLVSTPVEFARNSPWAIAFQSAENAIVATANLSVLLSFADTAMHVWFGQGCLVWRVSG